MTREAQSRVHYTVRQLPGMVQFSAAVREDATRVASSFGQRYAVDVWYREAGRHHLLAAYRPMTSAGAPSRADDVLSTDGADPKRR